MKTYFLHGARDLRLEEVTQPEITDDQLLIEVKYTGICGSDVHYYNHGYCGRFIPERPFALGHEFSGIVVKSGKKVDGFPINSAVAIDPSMPCRKCSFCSSGRYNLCENMRYFGSASCRPHLDGGFGKYVAVPAENCFILPPNVSLKEASLLEPLCVALHAVMQAGNVSGKSVLITGGGTIGQLILRVLKSFGATSVTVSDVSDFAREFSLKSGATSVINPTSPVPDLKEFEIVFEASGAEMALQFALEAIQRGGTLVQIGSLAETVSIPANLIMTKELTVKGSFRFANVFKMALSLIDSGNLKLDGIITSSFPFNEIPTAMDKALNFKNSVKIQIEM